MKKHEAQFAKILFGWGFFELGGKYATFFEQNNLADSVFYVVALSGALFGVYLMVDGCLKLYIDVAVKKPLNTVTKQPYFQLLKAEVKKYMKFLERFVKDVRGEASAKSIIGLAIGFVLMAVLAPIGLDQIYAANTTLWETAVTTIFTLVLPIVFIIGGAMKFVQDIRS